MKKIITVLTMVMAMGLRVLAMIPGPPQVVECPKCGEEKRLMSIISGNTFGATQWSDLYMNAPMLPRVSQVQKCDGCGGYFMLSKAKKHYAEDNDHSADTGRLTFEEISEALIQLGKDSLDREDEFALRQEFLHRYNDAYRGGAVFRKKSVRQASDHQLYLENIKAMIALLDETNSNELPVIAELYREAGDFDKCLSILKEYRPKSDYVRSVVRSVIENAEAKNDKVFVIDD